MFFLVLVYVFNFDSFEFLAAILEKGLFYINTLSPDIVFRLSRLKGTVKNTAVDL